MRHTLENYRSMLRHRRWFLALALGAAVLPLVGCQSPQAEVVPDKPGEGVAPAESDGDSTQTTTTISEGSESITKSDSEVDGSQNDGDSTTTDSSESKSKTDGDHSCKTAHISEVIKEQANSILSCSEHRTQPNEELKENMTVEWRIELDGEVSKFRVIDSTLDDPQAHDCVRQVVEQLSFD